MSHNVASVDYGSTVTDGIRTVTTFIPKLIGAVVILVIGYFLAKVVAKIVGKVLERVGFDQAVEKGGVKKALANSPYDAAGIVAKIVFYAIFIPFLSAAVSALGIVALEVPLAAFIALIPKILVAIVLVVIGGVVAGAVKALIQNSLGGLSYGKILADVVGVLVLLGFVKAALDEVGVATNVTGPLLIAILATVAGILIVGVGGALIKPMQSRLEAALTKATDDAQNLRQQAAVNPSFDQDATRAYPTSTASSVRTEGPR